MPFDVELGMFFVIIDHRLPGLEGVVAEKEIIGESRQYYELYFVCLLVR